MHRPRNVGSALQAYALQRSIEALGVRCSIIDYLYPNAFHGQATLKSQVLAAANRPLKRLFGQGHYELSEHRFDMFLKQYLNLTKPYPDPDSLLQDPPRYDIYMTGSDQVWRADYIRGDSSFFCAFAPPGKPVVSYGSSFGVAAIPDQYRETYAQYLMRFSRISVREEQAAELVKSLTGKEAAVVLDPTLLLDDTQWQELIPRLPERKPYALCYGDVYSASYMRAFAAHVHRATGLEIVWLFGRPWDRFRREERHIFDVGPLEFLAWVKGAALVLTQSFHGTIFAANFGRPFYSVHHTSVTRNTRQTNILKTLGCEHRGLEVGDPFPSAEAFARTDWPLLQERLRGLRQESLRYLGAALDGASA